MDRDWKDKLVGIVVWSLYGVVFWFAAIGITHKLSPKQREVTSDTTRVTVVDTIPYYEPVARDSVVVRYELAKLPIGKGDKPYYASLSLSKPVDSVGRVADSVSVELPITQKRYEDSTYTAWVSGYKPRLDSIYVYPRHETVTITNTIRQKPRRWGLGVSAGYGYAPGKGMAPYIGVGVNYTLISF